MTARVKSLSGIAPPIVDGTLFDHREGPRSYAPEFPTPTQKEEIVNATQDPLAPAHFIAGVYFGITGIEKEDYVLECYKPDE